MDAALTALLPRVARPTRGTGPQRQAGKQAGRADSGSQGRRVLPAPTPAVPGPPPPRSRKAAIIPQKRKQSNQV